MSGVSCTRFLMRQRRIFRNQTYQFFWPVKPFVETVSPKRLSLKKKNENENKKRTKCAKKVVERWKIVFLVKNAIFISELRRRSAIWGRFIEPHHECRVKSYFYLIVVIQKLVADFRSQAIFEKTSFYILIERENSWVRVSQMRKYLILRISEVPHQQCGAGDPRH